MTEHDCRFVRERIAVTGQTDDPGLSAHLSSCPGCRAEVVRMKRVFAWLTRDGRVEPSSETDTRIRRLITASRARPVLSPAVALGLAVIGFVALISALASPAVQAAADGRASALLILALASYLVLTTAASVPILLLHRRRARQTLEEVAS